MKPGTPALEFRTAPSRAVLFWCALSAPALLWLWVAFVCIGCLALPDWGLPHLRLKSTPGGWNKCWVGRN